MTSSIHVTPIRALKELRAKEIYNVGPLSTILLQEKKENMFAPYYYIVFGLAIALIATAVFTILQRRRKRSLEKD